jgi:regulation of enolase protein 1 (concanavalin A-like superfamily)
MLLPLAALAGMFFLVAGTQPAMAQDEKTPAFAQVLPSDGQVLVTWGAVKDATGYNVLRRNPGEDISAAKAVNAQPTKDTSLIDTGLTNDKPLLYAVQAVFADGSKGDPAEAVGTPHKAILGKFQYYDIETLNPGGVTIADNVLTIRASGADIWDGEDGQTFLATPVAGDFTITMKLNEVPKIENDESSAFGKVGVQAKNSITPDDAYALVFASVERTPEFMFEGRRAAGQDAEDWSGGVVDFEDAKFPVWLRLQRTGNTFISSYSNDGTTFNKVHDNQNIQNPPATMYVGIAATAHNADLYINGKIDATSIVITTP